MVIALSNYRVAADRHWRAIQDAKSLSWRSDADGRHGLYQAANFERHALEEYVHALRAYHDVMLGGSAPVTSPQPAMDSDTGALTPRQKQILKLIAMGLTSVEIASKLRISFKTVVVHRQNMMKRLDVHEVVSLVRYAYRNRLLEP